MKRVGYRYIYSREDLLRAFMGLAPTAHQSIRRAPFEDVLAELSDKNAMAT